MIISGVLPVSVVLCALHWLLANNIYSATFILTMTPLLCFQKMGT